MSQEKIKPTAEEYQRIAECMKNDEFRNELFNLMDSWKDPKVMEEQKEYLRQVEREAQEEGGGKMKQEFVFPEGKFCFKAMDEGRNDVFINVCTSDKIEPASESKDWTGDKQAAPWSIPICVGKPRETDNEGTTCTVYDCVFNAYTVGLCEKSPSFMAMIFELCLEHVNEGHKPSLKLRMDSEMQRTSVKGPVPACAVPVKGPPGGGGGGAGIGGLAGMQNMQTVNMMPNLSDSDRAEAAVKAPPKTAPAAPRPKKAAPKKADAPPEGMTMQSENAVRRPKYEVVHKGEVDLQQFFNVKEDVSRRIPKQLEVRIKLPGVENARHCELELTSDTRMVFEEKRAHFYLDLDLRFAVSDQNYKAKFDRHATPCQLVVTFTVIPEKCRPNTDAAAWATKIEDKKRQDAAEARADAEREAAEAAEAARVKAEAAQREREAAAAKKRAEDERKAEAELEEQARLQALKELAAERQRELAAKAAEEAAQKKAADAAAAQRRADLAKADADRLRREREEAAKRDADRAKRLEEKMRVEEAKMRAEREAADREARVPLDNKFIFALD